jgi:hypothetical protein
MARQEIFGLQRRDLLATGLALSSGAALPAQCQARPAHPVRFDRAAYDRYVALMNAGDPRFLDSYTDDVRFVMNIHGRAAVADFYARRRPFVRETLKVDFFCSDVSGAASQVLSEIRCIRDCEDATLFGRPLKAGEVQIVRGCLLYVLDPGGRIAQIKGPPPEIVTSWHLEPV